MPFLGKDWRSNGDEWIKTEQGWERTKVLECILDNLNTGFKNKLSRLSVSDENEDENSLNLSCSEASEMDLGNEFSETNFDDSDLSDTDTDTEIENDTNLTQFNKQEFKKVCPKSLSLRKLSMSTSSIEKKNLSIKSIQPHIIYLSIDLNNRENNSPRASVSEVLNALDMPGAVKDMKRFNYVCRLVQLIINEKFNQLSGNAQRTLFMIVKEMLTQVIKTQENLNIMRKLLTDLKKKIQDSYFYYFYHIGSQKLGEKHLLTLSKWQEKLENPSTHKRIKRLSITNKKLILTKENNKTIDFESIPLDCKIEIMRRLNTGLDLVNLSKCNRGLNEIINHEINMWKDLCRFHFQQNSINSLVNQSLTQKTKKSIQDTIKPSQSKINQKEKSSSEETNDLDWKSIYFKLKKRYGHREIYIDMIHRCFNCKCLFWKEIGHPCIIKNNHIGNEIELELKTEPITPKKLIELLLQ